MKLVELTKGLRAVVDDRDWPAVSCFKWYAQHAKPYFYACRREGKRLILLHRWLLIGNAESDLVVDHINLDTLDCRRDNLRTATHSQNHANAPKIKNTSVQFKGVCFVPKVNRRNPFMAYIGTLGNRKYLGYFPTAKAAADAYNSAAVALWGAFARLNIL